MKRILKVILPAILMLILTYVLQGGKNILEGLYIIFPLMYVAIVIICVKWELVASLILTSIAFIIPINLLYNMGSCIDLLVIYNVIALIAYVIKINIRKKKAENSTIK